LKAIPGKKGRDTRVKERIKRRNLNPTTGKGQGPAPGKGFSQKKKLPKIRKITPTCEGEHREDAPKKKSIYTPLGESAGKTWGLRGQQVNKKRKPVFDALSLRHSSRFTCSTTGANQRAL